MKSLLATGLLVLLAACESQPERRTADAWKQHYARQPLEAKAAGTDCRVLLIHTEINLDDPTVESIHYGITPYDVYQDGAQQFAHDRGFRAVVYRDASGGLWTYGAIARKEAEALPRCR